MGRYWNQGKKELPKYEVEDLVMITGINLKTRKLLQKLNNKLHRPFQVEMVITPMGIQVSLQRL
jgi:hypothetical protein